VHREQRIARVSESADTDEPQKKHSVGTLVSDLERIVVLVFVFRNRTSISVCIKYTPMEVPCQYPI
jgi:hypothetical protein